MSSSAHAVPFTLHIPDVPNDLKVLAFDGTEGISHLYAIDIELVGERRRFEVESLLGQPAFLAFGLNGEGIHGRIEHAHADTPGEYFTRYSLTLVPALHYLQFSFDCRIFRQMTVPQIIAQVLEQHGILADAYTLQVAPRPEHEYLTQYKESDFAFIQRLCAEEGIAWHHRHSPEGHHLLFTDDQRGFSSLGVTPYLHQSGMVADHPVVNRFSIGYGNRPSIITRRSYNFERPDLLCEDRAQVPAKRVLEDYRYVSPSEYKAHGKWLAQRSLERHRVHYSMADGESDQPALRSGYLFDLTDHWHLPANGAWLLIRVHHTGKQPQVLEEWVTDIVSPQDGFTQGYRNTFSAIAGNVVYRPPMPQGRPALTFQTARVTGPAGEDIYCDEYGRVKIEFHWDRARLTNEKSSCWARVVTSWAGEGFGTVMVPRVGMEVVVTFIEGDPDQPIVIGCAPNELKTPAYPLPEHKTKTVLRTRSMPANGRADYNELSIEDRAGQEKIYLRAQRDLEQHIWGNLRLVVGNERHETIKGNNIVTVEGEDHCTVTGDRKVQIEGNDYLNVAGSLHTRGSQMLVAEAGQQVHIKAGANIVVDAGASITLKAGGQHIVIGPGGIFSSSEAQLGGTPAQSTAAEIAPGMQLAPPEPPFDIPPHFFVEAARAGRAFIHLPEMTEDAGPMEEEEEDVELEQLITLRIGVFFDGTGNNQANSESVAGCMARDVGLENEADEIQRFCAEQGYGIDGSAPDSSYGNDTSNIARLYDLYRDQTGETIGAEDEEASIAVYLEGIGTISGAADDLYGQATGRGKTGVVARVEQSPASIYERLKTFRYNNPDLKIKSIEIDVFGFSRGAAAARHFANDVRLGANSLLAKALPASLSILAEGFAWQWQRDICLNFIGLFDTVPGIVSPLAGDFSPGNNRNPGLNLALPAGTARKVVQLVARDEHRPNFALVRTDHDLVLPGAHSDIGGGYLPRMRERLLVSKPTSSHEAKTVSNDRSTAASQVRGAIGPWVSRLVEQGVELGLHTWSVDEQRTRDNLRPGKRVYAVARIEREVLGDLSKIYLRVMRELAVQHRVPLRAIDEIDQRWRLPEELKPVLQKLQAYALGQLAEPGLTQEEESLLLRRYIHLSANWNAVKERHNTDIRILFVNRPADNHQRVSYDNE